MCQSKKVTSLHTDPASIFYPSQTTLVSMPVDRRRSLFNHKLTQEASCLPFNSLGPHLSPLACCHDDISTLLEGLEITFGALVEKDTTYLYWPCGNDDTPSTTRQLQYTAGSCSRRWYKGSGLTPKCLLNPKARAPCRSNTTGCLAVLTGDYMDKTDTH